MTGTNTGSHSEFPWWLVAMVCALCAGGWWIASDPVYRPLLDIVLRGLWTTVWVTLAGFFLACVLGLALALAGNSRCMAVRQGCRFVTEAVRGVPVIVMLFYIAFVATPAAVAAWNWLASQAGAGLPQVQVRDISLVWRAVAALVVSYGAFVSEIFRAGIAAVGPGQTEAARSLGLGPVQVFRFIILPQAMRIVLPPLGNDFISMIKDSSLVSAIGVADIAFMGKAAASTSFRFFEAYNVVAFLYLVMTIGLSVLVRWLERRLRRHEVRR